VPVGMTLYPRVLRVDKGFRLNLRSARISCIRTLHPSPALYNHLNYFQYNPYLQDSTDARRALHRAFRVFSFSTSVFILSLLNNKNRPIRFTRIDTINRSFYAIGIRPNRLQILFPSGFESPQWSGGSWYAGKNGEAAQQEPYVLFARLRK
jgi:hypothetical protein